MGESEIQGAAARTARSKWLKLGVLAVLIATVVVAYSRFGEALSLDNLAAWEGRLREYQRANPILVYGCAFLIYVIVTGLSLPGALVMTLLFGWYFGLVRALVLVSFASTTGATLAFLLSRYLLRGWIQARFGARLTTFNEALRREGAFYLFTLRLIPQVPFFVINVVMGLTPIRTFTYWWVSQVGMLPGTVVYVYFGTTLPNLQNLAEINPSKILTPPLITAFVLLGLFPIVVKKLVERFRGKGRDA